MSSNSGTKSPNVINYELSVGGGLPMGVVESSVMNEAWATTDDDAPMTPYILHDALPAGSGLYVRVVEDVEMNKARAAADSSAPVAPNVLNDALPAGGGLSMVLWKMIKWMKHELLT